VNPATPPAAKSRNPRLTAIFRFPTRLRWETFRLS
jgi:hypothetical protein